MRNGQGVAGYHLIGQVGIAFRSAPASENIIICRCSSGRAVRDARYRDYESEADAPQENVHRFRPPPLKLTNLDCYRSLTAGQCLVEAWYLDWANPARTHGLSRRRIHYLRHIARGPHWRPQR